MKLPVVAVLIVVTALGGCAKLQQSKFNPLNWFSRAKPVEMTDLYQPTEDPRDLVAQVTQLHIDPYPGGAIVRATGVPTTQGYWAAELVPQPVDENGRLVYDFRVFAPTSPAAQGTAFSRQITVAATLSDAKLRAVTSIVVQGQGNALSARR